MRIYASDNDPLDFCRQCFPCEAEAFELYGHRGDGPDNRGDGPDNRGNCFEHDAEHPDYDGYAGYRCHACGKRLGEQDN
jgi:hypothetical protein